MSDIFVSYKTTDKERVRTLVELLKAQGLNVWWDRNIPPGKTFDQVIEEAINAASCLVVVWSAASVASDWVKTEAAEGARRGILVPVMIDDVSIPLEFRRIQAAKLTDLPRPPGDPDVQGLLASVARTIERERLRREKGSSSGVRLGTEIRRARELQKAREAAAQPPAPEPPPAGGKIRRFGDKQLLRAAALVLPAVLVALMAAYLVLGGPRESDSGGPPPWSGPVTFIGVDSGDDNSRADEKLIDYLRGKVSQTISRNLYDYETVVDKLSNWDRADGAFLARTTPYVYVAAEMLGADVEILATYQSEATRSTTYYSYFVVNRQDFSEQPGLDDVMRFLRDKPGERPRFIYHSKFSTSSYFLPSLYFRRHKVFNMERSAGSLTAIDSRQIDADSSSELVRQVARGEADLAAVWDGTMKKFKEGGAEYETVGRHVYFVKVDTALPNDLLVCSGFLAPEVRSQIRQAIGAMEGDEASQIRTGDFLWWKDWLGAVEAREALASLRWSAAGADTPVTVEISPAEGGRPVPEPYLEAARQAVRLSSTEFVVFDPDFHHHTDFIWTLETIHDGTLRLTSKIKGLADKDLRQEHWISFADEDELTSRISSFIQTRMHRIRYLWPYDDRPTLIRDFGFSVPPGTPATAQRVTWLNPERNQLTEGRYFESRIASSDFNKLTLDGASFKNADFHADPMSNVAMRVILTRPLYESPFLRLLTYLFVSLLVAAAAAVVFDARRGRKRVLARAGRAMDLAKDALTKSGIWKRPQVA